MIHPLIFEPDRGVVDTPRKVSVTVSLVVATIRIFAIMAPELLKQRAFVMADAPKGPCCSMTQIHFIR
jgi:hypothetical protein